MLAALLVTPALLVEMLAEFVLTDDLRAVILTALLLYPVETAVIVAVLELIDFVFKEML